MHLVYCSSWMYLHPFQSTKNSISILLLMRTYEDTALYEMHQNSSNTPTESINVDLDSDIDLMSRNSWFWSGVYSPCQEWHSTLHVLFILHRKILYKEWEEMLTQHLSLMPCTPNPHDWWHKMLKEKPLPYQIILKYMWHRVECIRPIYQINKEVWHAGI